MAKKLTKVQIDLLYDRQALPSFVSLVVVASTEDKSKYDGLLSLFPDPDIMVAWNTDELKAYLKSFCQVALKILES